MLRALKLLLLAVTLTATALVGGIYAYSRAAGPLDHPETVIIPRGAGFRGTLAQLEARGVIASPWLFAALAAGSGNARKLKAGEYLFPAAIAPGAVMDMLVEGRVVPHKITIPEGLTAHEIRTLLAREPLLSGEIEGIIEEGSLLPETYHFIYGDARAGIIERMRLAMAIAVAQLWPKRAAGLPFETPEQAITLASIVEKETRIEEERGLIAAVFVNRLKRGMRLQADPTVIYAIEREKGKLDRPLTTKDLAYVSPYNTYLVPGLPPGAICNPGLASLEAVLNPPETDAYYFVADGEGGHHFSGTLEKHNRNVREYRRQRKR